MANPSPPSNFSTLLLFFLLANTTISAASTTVNGVNPVTTSQEVETMLESLRNHGHTLFTNAITTSDLQYQLLTTTASEEAAANRDSPFTLFAPKDALLYALDMTSDAAAYISTLRYHVIPNHRHSFADLQTISSPFLDTLLPHYSVLIGRTQVHNNASVGVMVDGVRVSNPDLFIGSGFAVHGIDGILVTGLNMNQDLVSKDNGLGLFPPAESPYSGFDRNIPAEGSPSQSPAPQFDWKNIPVAPMYPFDGNINPVAAPPERSQDHPEKMNSFKRKKKKRVKGHQKGQGSRRDGGLHYHRLNDL